MDCYTLHSNLRRSSSGGEMEEVGRLLESFHLRCETAALLPSASSSPSTISPSSPLITEHLSPLAHSYRSLYLSHSSLHDKDQLLVWTEIMSSCSKKLISLLRSLFSNSVNSLLISYRKHLKSSVALSSSSSSSSATEPNQRYFQCLYDLLGSWGALIETVRSLFGETSSEVLYGWLVPFHRRVVEASLESYEEFKNNKKLNHWLVKHSEIAMAAPGTLLLPSLPPFLSI